MMRTIWKGHIQFSLVTIPIKVYNGVDTSEKVSLNEFHKGDCGGSVGRKSYCKKCDEIVTADQVVKGFKLDGDDSFVEISKEDLSSIKLESNKVIHIEAFVEENQIPETYYDSPYLVAPDGKVAETSYPLLVAALKSTKTKGVGKIILRDREDIVALMVQGDALVMNTLRYSNEMRNPNAVPGLDKIKKVDVEQLGLACGLINTMYQNFNELDIENKYNKAFQELVNAKIENKVVPIAEVKQPKQDDVMDVLRASIAAAAAKRGAGAKK